MPPAAQGVSPVCQAAPEVMPVLCEQVVPALLTRIRQSALRRDSGIVIHLFEPAVHLLCLFHMIMQDLLRLLPAHGRSCFLRNISVRFLTVHQESILSLYLILSRVQFFPCEGTGIRIPVYPAAADPMLPVLFQPAHRTVCTVIYITYCPALRQLHPDQAAVSVIGIEHLSYCPVILRPLSTTI